MRVYLDNCCYNRPFDEQDQLSVQIETEAKLTNRAPIDYTKWRATHMFVGETLDDVLDRAERADRRYKERQQAIAAATV